MSQRFSCSQFVNVCLVFLLLSTFFLASGCVKESQTIIRGWVVAGEPVSESYLTIYNTKGKQIFKTPTPATGAYGSFTIVVSNLPADFRVVSSNGYLGEEPLESTLSADYRNFNPEEDIIYLNAVTTLVSNYLDKNPDSALDEAVLMVKNFLNIPEFADINSRLNNQNEYFCHQVFFDLAREHGGIASFIDQLAAAMNKSATASVYSFTPIIPPYQVADNKDGMLGGIAMDVTAFVATNLAKGAVSHVGGKIMGWGLSMLGLSGSPDTTKEDLEEIKAQLADLKDQFSQMQSQLVDMSRTLNDLKYQLQQMERNLISEIKQSGWDGRISQLIPLITNIAKTTELLTIFISNPPEDLKVLDYKRAEIMNLIETNLLYHDDDLHSQLIGIASATPLLKLWSQVVKSQKRYLTTEDSAMVRSQFEYFDTLQLWLTTLIIEYYHTKAIFEEEASPMYDEYISRAEAAINKYYSNREAQLELVLPPVPEGMLYDTEQDCLFVWRLDGEIYYPKLTWEEAKAIVNSWQEGKDSSVEYLWWVPVDTRLNKVFVYGGNMTPLDYAVSQGWPREGLSPVMTLAAQSDGRPADLHTVISLGGYVAPYTVERNANEVHTYIFNILPYKFDSEKREYVYVPMSYFW